MLRIIDLNDEFKIHDPSPIVCSSTEEFQDRFAIHNTEYIIISLLEDLTRWIYIFHCHFDLLFEEWVDL